MAAGNWFMTDSGKLQLLNGTVNWEADTIKIALFNSSYTPTVAATTTYSTTNELATANGYTQGGVTMTATSSNSGSTTKLSASNNAVWTASGGSITARYAVLYKATGNQIIGFVLLDTTPADVTATTGNTFTITTPAGGFFSYTGATS